VCVVDGRIRADPPSRLDAVIDGAELTVMPGLIDVHVHFREPGNEQSETIAGGVRSAARGGFTTVVTMPNTRPPVDSPEAVAFQMARARAAGPVRVLPSACLTRERAGREPADLAALARAGAVAFTDDGSTVSDDSVMEAVMRAAAALDRPVFDHALDPVLAGHGVLHEGSASRRLGLPGIPSEAETRIVGRDIELVQRTGCRLHLQHLSSAEAVARVREARACRLPVTAEITPHHLLLSDADIPGDDANFKMNPPLRTPADREALRHALEDGTVTCLATDHAPHSAALKARGMREAPFGVVGLETALALTYRELVHVQGMDPFQWVRLWTTGPAAVLGLPPPTLLPGAPADLALVDFTREEAVNPDTLVSTSRNTPFGGRLGVGRVLLTLCGGRVAWLDDHSHLSACFAAWPAG